MWAITTTERGAIPALPLRQGDEAHE